MSIIFEKRKVVVPGEILAEGPFNAGPGTYKDKNVVKASVIGLPELKGNNNIVVVPLQGAYIPKAGDIIIGKVVNTTIVAWKVEINSAYVASLHASTVLNRSFNPMKDDIRTQFDVGDLLAAEVIAFNRTRDPVLSVKGRGLGKLREGRIIEILPAKVPRLIGRKGSMINLIKTETNTRLIIGQNGWVWVSGKDFESEILVEKIIRKIEKESHTSGLTDRIKELINNEKNR